MLEPTKRKGGRQKGTPNKSKIDAQNIALRMKINPLEVLLLFCKGEWSTLGLDHRKLTDRDKGNFKMNAASEALQYILPKRKAVEHSGPDGKPMEVRAALSFTQKQIKQAAKEIADDTD